MANVAAAFLDRGPIFGSLGKLDQEPEILPEPFPGYLKGWWVQSSLAHHWWKELEVAVVAGDSDLDAVHEKIGLV